MMSKREFSHCLERPNLPNAWSYGGNDFHCSTIVDEESSRGSSPVLVRVDVSDVGQ